MNRVAVVMPLHRPKFGQAVNFAASLLGCGQMARYLWVPVFSSHGEQLLFLHLIASALPDWRNSSWQPMVVVPDTRNPVASKRLLALRTLFRSHAHAFALGVDAETVFASTQSFAQRFAQWHVTQEVLAARLTGNLAGCSRRVRIASSSCGIVGQESHGLYLWWLDAPIFAADGYEDFFSSLNWSALSIDTFDHFAYLCWLIRRRGWAVRDISSNGVDACKRGTDSISVPVQKSISGHVFLWCSASAAGCSERVQSRLLRYHLDRQRAGRTGPRATMQHIHPAAHGHASRLLRSCGPEP